MLMNYKKLIITTLIILFANISCFAMTSKHGLDGNEQYVIDAMKNARGHSNMGNVYFDEGNLISAIKEYEIAYKLTYKTSASSVYLYNLSRCYIKLKDYKQAKIYLEEAIKKDCLNMTYYKTLVDCYVALNIQDEELRKRLDDEINPYSRIVAGLIFLKTGNKITAKNIFDEFINDNPDMLITDDVRLILKQID